MVGFALGTIWLGLCSNSSKLGPTDKKLTSHFDSALNESYIGENQSFLIVIESEGTTSHQINIDTIIK